MLFSQNVVQFLCLSGVSMTWALQQPFLSDDYAKGQMDPSLEVITREVAIVGGGSSGTFAAIKLRQLNHSVVVIEQKGRLGGHTETYVDPATGGKVDMGVIVWHNLKIVKDYLAHFGIPLKKGKPGKLGSADTHHIDLQTGRPPASFKPPSETAVDEALSRYKTLVEKYPYLEEGFELPDPVPSELLLPFGEFAAKYHLGDMVHTAFQYGQGLGDFLNLSTLYVMKNFGIDVQDNIQDGFLITERGDNSELYRQATAELGSDVLFNSTVHKTDRDGSDADGYYQLLVRTPGSPKLIRAKQILLSIPPTIENLASFSLDKREYDIFSQFRHSYYWTGILRDTGIPSKLTLRNVGTNGSFNIPNLPGTYAFYPAYVERLTNVKYGSAIPLTDEQVRTHILDTLYVLRRNGEINFTTCATPENGEVDSPVELEAPSFAAFANHAPFELTVSNEAIEKGFYRDLYALQGYRNTWWTGAAWHTQDSSLLWEFTEKVVQRLIEKL